MNTKEVVGIYEPGASYWVGDGFPVRNLFPSTGIQKEVSPFLIFDYAGPTTFKPSNHSPGVGEHPHRGFETVTLAFQGSVAHRDSAGNSGVIYPGDVQWMTAASGVVHEEFHEADFARKGGTFEMVQLWVNLPKAHKMSSPRYQAITKEQIPVVELEKGGYIRIVAGELNGKKGAALTFTPINLFDISLKAGEKVEIPLVDGHNAAVVQRMGSTTINGSSELKGEAKFAVLNPSGNGVTLEATEDSGLLILSGEPINEPIVSQGPFVMNTRDEIIQAMVDYKAGRMGRLS